MKKISILFIIVSYVWFVSCNQTNQEHEHEHAQEEHTHGESKADAHEHVHEADHEHNHEAGDTHDHKNETEHQHSSHEHDSNEKNHEHDSHTHDNEIVIKKVQKAPFYSTIKTSGELLNAQSDEIIITAKSHGFIRFNDKVYLPGVAVQKGALLCKVSGENLAENNINVKYRQAKAAFEFARDNYERTKKLAADKIVSERELLESKAQYEKEKAQFENLSKNFQTESSNINFSHNGYLKKLLVSEGDFVSDGQALAVITKNEKLLVKADVSQKYFQQLTEIIDAIIIPSYGQKTYQVSKLNGKLISYGKHTENESFFTPVYFEIDYMDELISGSFIEVFLLTKEERQVISLPKTAILEEAGKLYVFVEEGEEFTKRYIQTGYSNGERIEITQGLYEGELVVTNGAYQVKLSKMNTAIPHGHSH